MKSSDIPDQVIWELVAKATRDDTGSPFSLMLWAIEEALPQYPRKVILAKVSQMIARGRLRGCSCGCRGDFRFPWEEFGQEQYRGNWQQRMEQYLKGPRLKNAY